MTTWATNAAVIREAIIRSAGFNANLVRWADQPEPFTDSYAVKLSRTSLVKDSDWRDYRVWNPLVIPIPDGKPGAWEITWSATFLASVTVTLETFDHTVEAAASTIVDSIDAGLRFLAVQDYLAANKVVWLGQEMPTRELSPMPSADGRSVCSFAADHRFRVILERLDPTRQITIEGVGFEHTDTHTTFTVPADFEE